MEPLTHEFLLKSMRPGSGYAVHMLALKIGVPASVLKPVLLEMLEAGKLSTFKRGKNPCFVIAGTEHLRRQLHEPKKPITDPERVAQRRTASPFVGELTGYVSEINQRVALAMMVRPR